MAEYPKEKGYRIAWVLDHSSFHSAYSDDALNAYKMIVKLRGK